MMTHEEIAEYKIKKNKGFYNGGYDKGFKEGRLAMIKEFKIKIHLIIDDGIRFSYLCNEACNTTQKKSTVNIKEVNCKNCLHLIKKNKLGAE